MPEVCGGGGAPHGSAPSILYIERPPLSPPLFHIQDCGQDGDPLREAIKDSVETSPVRYPKPYRVPKRRGVSNLLHGTRAMLMPGG